jgi:hypothetical protein
LSYRKTKKTIVSYEIHPLKSQNNHYPHHQIAEMMLEAPGANVKVFKINKFNLKIKFSFF